MKEQKKIVYMFGNAEAENSHSNIQKRAMMIDNDIRHLMNRITDYLYIPGEMNVSKNELFFNHVLYPYLLYFYKENNKLDTLTEALSELSRMATSVSMRITDSGYDGAGKYIMTSVLVLSQYEIAFKDSKSEIGEAQKWLNTISPYSPNDVEFNARLDDDSTLYQKISEGYVEFITRTIKFKTSEEYGIDILLCDEKLTDIIRIIESPAVQSALRFLRGKTKKYHSTEYKVAYNRITNIIRQLRELEKKLIISNNKEGIYKSRLYINALNSYLR